MLAADEDSRKSPPPIPARIAVPHFGAHAWRLILHYLFLQRRRYTGLPKRIPYSKEQGIILVE
jgi:hypothetical protein